MKKIILEENLQMLFNFKVIFDFLYENFGLNMTLKTHVILAHFDFYFKTTGTNFRNTNGEFFEAVYYSLKRHEVEHGYVVKRSKELLIICYNLFRA